MGFIERYNVLEVGVYSRQRFHKLQLIWCFCFCDYEVHDVGLYMGMLTVNSIYGNSLPKYE